MIEHRILEGLFDSLCVELGLCLRSEQRERVGPYLKVSDTAFVEEVLRADGVDPAAADSACVRRALEITRSAVQRAGQAEDSGVLFAIDFLEEWAVDEDGWVHAEGELTLGDYRESFRSELSALSVAGYRAQWRAAIEHLVNGASFTALWTSFAPDPEDVRFAWLLYRSDHDVYVTERLVLGPPPSGATEWPADSPWRELQGERQTHNESGQAISEWRLTFKAFEEYLARGAT